MHRSEETDQKTEPRLLRSSLNSTQLLTTVTDSSSTHNGTIRPDSRSFLQHNDNSLNRTDVSIVNSPPTGQGYPDRLFEASDEIAQESRRIYSVPAAVYTSQQTGVNYPTNLPPPYSQQPVRRVETEEEYAGETGGPPCIEVSNAPAATPNHPGSATFQWYYHPYLHNPEVESPPMYSVSNPPINEFYVPADSHRSQTSTVFPQQQGVQAVPNYLACSILMLFCCPIFGMVAIVLSQKANSLKNTNPEDASKKAKLAHGFIFAGYTIGLIGVAVGAYYLFRYLQ